MVGLVTFYCCELNFAFVNFFPGPRCELNLHNRNLRQKASTMEGEEEKQWQIQRFEKGEDLAKWVRGMNTTTMQGFRSGDVDRLVDLFRGTAGALSAAYAGSEGTKAQSEVWVVTLIHRCWPS